MREIIDNDLSLLTDKTCYILFYFTAKWCKPCQSIKPLLQKISDGSDSRNLELYLVDIDENDKLAEEFKIKSVPSFFMFHKNKLKDKCSGSDIKKVQKLIKNTMNNST